MPTPKQTGDRFPRRQIADRIQGAGPCSTGNWTSARGWRGSAIRASRFELAIFLKGGTDALVTGEIVWVNTNQQTHRPVPVSKAIREKIAAREKHLGE